MKALAYIANVAFLAAVVIVSYVNLPADPLVVFIVVLVALLPVLNLAMLFRSDRVGDIISLYFQRKRLEQEKKIYDLRNSMHEK